MAKWGTDFTPQAFKGTREQPGLTKEQNADILAALGGTPAAVATTRTAAPRTEDVPRRPAVTRTEAAPPPPAPRAEAQPAPRAPSVVHAASPRPPAPVASVRRTEAESSPTHSSSPSPATPDAELQRLLAASRRAEEKARQEAADARREAEEARQETEAARREAQQARSQPAARVAAPPAMPRQTTSAVRGPVHEKLTPKLMRFPPVLLERLAALALAYGLDQTSTVRLAVTELYERALGTGTVLVQQ